MATGTLGRSRRADARANHAAMVRAAAALLGDRQIELPYDEIALAAGVGRATVYRHFPTQDALARALLDDALDRWDEIVDGLTPGPAQFQDLFEAWIRRQQDRGQGIDLLACQAPQEDLRRARRRFEETLREPVHRAQNAGIVHAPLSVRDVRVILTMVSAARRNSDTPSDRRRAIDFARGLLFVPQPPAP